MEGLTKSIYSEEWDCRSTVRYAIYTDHLNRTVKYEVLSVSKTFNPMRRRTEVLRSINKINKEIKH